MLKGCRRPIGANRATHICMWSNHLKWHKVSVIRAIIKHPSVGAVRPLEAPHHPCHWYGPFLRPGSSRLWPALASSGHSSGQLWPALAGSGQCLDPARALTEV